MKGVRHLHWLLLTAACTHAPPIEPVANSCTQNFECASSDRCDRELGRCVSPQADRPYPFVVQVVTDGDREELVARTWNQPQILREAPDLGDLRVRDAVRIDGRVIGSVGAPPLQAEVAFFPRRAAPYLSPTLSAFTHLEKGEHVFTAQLDPNTTYDVRVVPLGRSDSRRYPPHPFVVSTETSDLTESLVYPQTVAFSGFLLEETPLPSGTPSRLADFTVRLRERASMGFVSSVGRIDEDGRYELYVVPEVLADLSKYELVLDLLPGGQPWLTTLAIDGERLRADAPLTIPDVPERVRFAINPLTQSDTLVPSAEFTFISDFQPPSDQAVRPQRDWCRLRASSNVSFRCSTQVTFAVNGEDELSLLPGYYEIFVSPNVDVRSANRVAAQRRTESILPQPDNLVQGPVTYELESSELYTGRVISPLREPMPLVTVTAYALNLADKELGDVAAYNRTSQAVSDAMGRYSLAVDVGSYDLIAAAPEGTGFSWYVAPNRQLTGENPTVSIPMTAPVVARGRVVDERGEPVFQARVEAFAIVEDQTGERALRIARTESSDAGTFALFLPPRIKHDPEPLAGGLDGGVALTSGLDAGVQP